MSESNDAGLTANGGWCAPGVLPEIKIERGGICFDPNGYPPKMKGLTKRQLKRLVRQTFTDKRVLMRRIQRLEADLRGRNAT